MNGGYVQISDLKITQSGDLHACSVILETQGKTFIIYGYAHSEPLAMADMFKNISKHIKKMYEPKN